MTDNDPHAHVSPAEQAEALSPDVGSGSPDTAPWESVEIPWLRRQPIVALALLILFTDLGAALTTISAGQASPLVVVLLGTLGTVVAVAAAVARRHVTPIALPRLDAETPLTIAPPVERP